MCFFPLAVIKLFGAKTINSTTVRAMWFEVDSPYLDHYSVYYYTNPPTNIEGKMKDNEKIAEFPAGLFFGVIGGLEERQEYLFTIAVTINVNGQVFEGQRTEPAPPG